MELFCFFRVLVSNAVKVSSQLDADPIDCFFNFLRITFIMVLSVLQQTNNKTSNFLAISLHFHNCSCCKNNNTFNSIITPSLISLPLKKSQTIISHSYISSLTAREHVVNDDICTMKSKKVKKTRLETYLLHILITVKN